MFQQILGLGNGTFQRQSKRVETVRAWFKQGAAKPRSNLAPAELRMIGSVFIQRAASEVAFRHERPSSDWPQGGAGSHCDADRQFRGVKGYYSGVMKSTTAKSIVILFNDCINRRTCRD